MINCNFFTQLASDIENSTKNLSTSVRHVSIRTGKNLTGPKNN